MPSSATITAFYSFTANTKARASQVQNNFDVFRGHFIPVHPSTATSVGSTYDLGSAEYRWRNAYFKSAFMGSTSTGYSIEESTTTSDALLFNQNGSNKFVINSSLNMTATAAKGQFGLSSYIEFGSASTSGGFGHEEHITNSTLTIQTIGKPVMLCLCNYDDTAVASAVQIGSGSTIATVEGYLILLRNGTQVRRANLGFSGSTAASGLTFEIPSVTFIDMATSGSVVYSLKAWIRPNNTFYVYNMRLHAKEIM
jgi:hypothetical protein